MTRPRLARPVPSISGLSPRGVAAIVRFESRHLWPGAAREAVDAWALFLRDPHHRLFDPSYGCGVPTCCPNPAELRARLEAIAHVLPRNDARSFRARLADLRVAAGQPEWFGEDDLQVADPAAAVNPQRDHAI